MPAGWKNTFSKGNQVYHLWVDGLIDRYDKKYRKYRNKPMSAWCATASTVPVTSTYLTVATTTSSTTSVWTSPAAQIFGVQPQQAQAMAQSAMLQQQLQAQIGPPSAYGLGLGTNIAPVLDRIFKVQDGQACEIQLPDGSVIHVDDAGSYTIDDKNAKVVYRVNRARDFNKFINVSDRIEEFFEFCGEQDVAAAEMMELPMKLFVGWLVIKAAEADKETPPSDIKLIPYLQQRAAPPRCRSCCRFISYAQKKANMEFCNAVCFDRKLAALKPKALPPPMICVPSVCESETSLPEPELIAA